MKFLLVILFVILLNAVMAFAWYFVGFWWMLPAGCAVMPLFVWLRNYREVAKP